MFGKKSNFGIVLFGTNFKPIFILWNVENWKIGPINNENISTFNTAYYEKWTTVKLLGMMPLF